MREPTIWSIEKVITAVSMKDHQTKKEIRAKLSSNFSHHHRSVSMLDRCLKWLLRYNIIFKMRGIKPKRTTVNYYIINEAFR